MLPLLSLKVMLTDVVAGSKEEQLKTTVLLTPLVLLERFTQLPAVNWANQLVMSVPLSASLAVALA